MVYVLWFMFMFMVYVLVTKYNVLKIIIYRRTVQNAFHDVRIICMKKNTTVTFSKDSEHLQYFNAL